MPGPASPLITCEHAGNAVPARYAALFAGAQALLDSHRGWDPGALETGRDLARAVAAPLIAARCTRLLIDLNRSIGNPSLYSTLTRALPPAERRAIVEEFYLPHRDAVLQAVAQVIQAGGNVLHVASHSFTPELDGVVRTADIGFLYDPRRSGEAAFAACWRDALAALRPDLRLRRNYPYQGKGDGLTATLRQRHAPAQYVGIELEVNQRFAAAGGKPWHALRQALAASLGSALKASAAAP